MASKIRTVLHIFDWLIFHYFLLLIFRLTTLKLAAKSNLKLVNQKLCNTVLSWMPFSFFFKSRKIHFVWYACIMICMYKVTKFRKFFCSFWAGLSRKAKKCHENIVCVIDVIRFDSKVSILGVVAIWAIAWLFRKIRGFYNWFMLCN